MNDAPLPVDVRHLTAHYGSTLVLDDVSFHVRPNEILVILGGSGCGKSTLLKHVIRLLEPTSGHVSLLGCDITHADEETLAPLRRRIGVSFQSSGLFNSMTLGENVALPLREAGGFDEVTIGVIVRMKLRLVGLGEAVHKMPAELSGGMKKRAGLARALALDPEVVFFDEPSAGLDPIMAAGLDQLILQLRDLLGVTMVIVTHELESIRAIADRVLMLDRGKVLYFGDLDGAETSDEPRVRQFFGRIPDDRIGAPPT